MPMPMLSQVSRCSPQARPNVGTSFGRARRSGRWKGIKSNSEGSETERQACGWEVREVATQKAEKREERVGTSSHSPSAPRTAGTKFRTVSGMCVQAFGSLLPRHV